MKRIVVAALLCLGVNGCPQYPFTPFDWPEIEVPPILDCLPDEYWNFYLVNESIQFSPDEYRWWREYYPIFQGGDHVAYTWWIVKAKSYEELRRESDPTWVHPMLEDWRDKGYPVAYGPPFTQCFDKGMHE